MKAWGCLLRLLVFLVLLPIVFAMPTLAFFIFAWATWTAYFLSKD